MPFLKASTEPPGFSPSRTGHDVRRESRVTRLCYRLKNEPYTNLLGQYSQVPSLEGGCSLVLATPTSEIRQVLAGFEERAPVALEAVVSRQARGHLRSTFVAWPSPGRRTVVVALSVSLFGVSVALPLLDAREESGITSIESAHDPGRCATLHDHAACAQLARSPAVQAGPAPGPCFQRETSRVRFVGDVCPRAFPRRAHSFPRAPPSNA